MWPLTDFLMQRLTLNVQTATRQRGARHADVRNRAKASKVTIAKTAGKLRKVGERHKDPSLGGGGERERRWGGERADRV